MLQNVLAVTKKMPDPTADLYRALYQYGQGVVHSAGNQPPLVSNPQRLTKWQLGKRIAGAITGAATGSYGINKAVQYSRGDFKKLKKEMTQTAKRRSSRPKPKAKGKALVARGNKQSTVNSFKGSARRGKSTVLNRVKELEKLQPKKAVKIYKRLDTVRHINNVNVCNYNQVNAYTLSDYVQVLDSVMVFDRATGDRDKLINLVTNDNNAALYEMACYHKLVMCNNERLPCDMRAYLFECNEYTGQGPVVWLNLIDGTVGANSWSSAPNMYPTDVLRATKGHQKWKIVETLHHRLQPGDEVTIKTAGNIKYNPQVATQSQGSYQKGDRVWLIRQVGTICHDATTATAVGLSETALDMLGERVIKYTYDHETPYISLDQEATLDAMPEGSVKAGPNAVDLSL